MAHQAPRAKNPLGWIGSASSWLNPVGDGWVGKKVLGQGGQGIAGLWSYGGSDRDSKPLKEVVVKQGVTSRSDGITFTGLAGEAEMLRLLGVTGSSHILKMYRRLYVDQGGGHGRIDQGEVHRIFLEYCPGGDLFHWGMHATNTPEVELWAMFHCLALGTLAMHHGREDANEDRWNRDEICHFDLKLDNILLGEVTTDNEHINARPLKIADFGLAVSVPDVQDRRFHDRNAFTGTIDWLLPEQIVIYAKTYSRPWVEATGTKVTSLRYGTASNIWQIGMIMWCLMREMHEPNWDTLKTYQSGMSRRLQRGHETLGTALDQNEGKGIGGPKYSKHLRAVISKCLLIQSSSRLLPARLVEKTRRGLAIARAAAPIPATPIPSPHTSTEPQLDQRWYSGAAPLLPERSHVDYPTPEALLMITEGSRNAANAEAHANVAVRAAAREKQRAEWAALRKARAARTNPLAMNPTAPHTPATPATPVAPSPQVIPETPLPTPLQLGVPRTPQAAAPAAPRLPHPQCP